MLKPVFHILTAAAVTGIALAPGAASAAPLKPTPLAHAPKGASAAPLRPTALAHSSTNDPSGGDPDTSVTFTVTTSNLSMTAPASADIGSGAPGAVIAGTAGPVIVTDARAGTTGWSATASSTAWTNGTTTIPASDVTYAPGTISTTGTVTAAGTSITLSAGSTQVVVGSGVVGNNSATWTPGLSLTVPLDATGGSYTATLTQAVS
jgi:hypothetical protein